MYQEKKKDDQLESGRSRRDQSQSYQLKRQQIERFKHSQMIQRKSNNTGLPDNLKSGIESLSGYSMDNVKVHYNSDKPAQLQAHAYAQGADIHLAAGQEKHLPHEAWHVVQQMQGRVRPTLQMKSQTKAKVNINDNSALEREADVMGTKALQIPLQMKASENEGSSRFIDRQVNEGTQTLVQRVLSDSSESFESLESLELSNENMVQAILSQVGTDFKNNPLRMAYEAEVKALSRYADRMQSEMSLEDKKKLAYEANDARRQLGIKYKDMTPEPLRDFIYYVNVKRYQDSLGPTVEYSLKRGRTYDDIIQSAAKSNSDIDKLLAGFSSWLEDQSTENLKKYKKIRN